MKLASYEYLVKHGCARVGRPTSEYIIWSTMKRRCLNPKGSGYKYYGARGISVCERWMSFPNFLADMGLRPKGLSLDRIDNDGNYEPSNCRWATASQQRQNRRSTERYLEYGEVRLSLKDMSKKYGLSKRLLSLRLHRGMSVEKALTMPVQHKHV